MRKLALVFMVILGGGAAGTAHGASYQRVIERVAQMVDDTHAQELVERRRLQILNVMWEDTGRWFGSSVGPNISDVTIEVQDGDRTTLMPVIRGDNFTDVTGDVKMDKLMIPVGNQTAQGQLETIPLTELLRNPGKYLSLPQKGRIKGGTLLAQRDSHVLVSAQTAFLPVPREGKATFWPVIFNYQSSPKHPAVLAILVTRQGTSMTIVDNSRDSVGGDWGQRLFFNDRGQRAPLLAERLSDVERHGETANGESADSLGADANLLMLIQVPLKVAVRLRHAKAADSMMLMQPSFGDGGGGSGGAYASAPRSDVEVAVVGHGPQLGPFTELDGLTIERDPRFPVRATVQFYQATSTGKITAADVRGFAQQIRKVYKQADYVGSLVVPSPKDLERPTLWQGASRAPSLVSFWDFPGLVDRATRLGWKGFLVPRVRAGVQ
jgi:hypothetical protein